MALALTKPQARKLYVSCFWAQKLVLGQLELLPYLWQTTPEISRGKEGLNQMTNSTKLTDIPGAKEALDIPWAINYNVHLEVDVEAMAKAICLAEYPDAYIWDHLNENEKEFYRKLARGTSGTILEWARLVRK